MTLISIDLKNYGSFLLAIFLAMGISLSGFFLSKNSVHFFPLLLSLIGIIGFFSLHLLMEAKDQLIMSIDLMQSLLFIYCMILWVFLQAAAALAYAFLSLYLWLNYKQFYYAKLSKHYVLRGLLRQASAFPLAIFAFAAASNILH